MSSMTPVTFHLIATPQVCWWVIDYAKQMKVMVLPHGSFPWSYGPAFQAKAKSWSPSYLQMGTGNRRPIALKTHLPCVRLYPSRWVSQSPLHSISLQCAHLPSFCLCRSAYYSPSSSSHFQQCCSQEVLLPLSYAKAPFSTLLLPLNFTQEHPWCWCCVHSSLPPLAVGYTRMWDGFC